MSLSDIRLCVIKALLLQLQTCSVSQPTCRNSSPIEEVILALASAIACEMQYK